MVCRLRVEYGRTVDGERDVHGLVEAERGSRFRTRTASVFRYRDRCGKVLFGEIRYIHHYAGGGADDFFYGIFNHSTVIQGNSCGSGREWRKAEKPLRVLL